MKPLPPIRTQTRWIDAVSASVQACPDGVAISFYSAPEENRDTSNPSAVIFMTRPQFAALKRTKCKPLKKGAKA